MRLKDQASSRVCARFQLAIDMNRIIFGSLAFSCLCLPQRQASEPPDFAHDLGLVVSDVEPLDTEASRAVLRDIGGLVGESPSFVSRIKLYSGKAVPRRAETPVPAWFATVPPVTTA